MFSFHFGENRTVIVSIPRAQQHILGWDLPLVANNCYCAASRLTLNKLKWKETKRINWKQNKHLGVHWTVRVYVFAFVSSPINLMCCVVDRPLFPWLQPVVANKIKYSSHTYYCCIYLYMNPLLLCHFTWWMQRLFQLRGHRRSHWTACWYHIIAK